MSDLKPANLDALIVGGGAAGLWLLDVLHRRGHSCALVERYALGSGQTVASQGIIHGGVKYSLAGALTESAKAIRDMPAIWRRCLSGDGERHEPDLSRVCLRAGWCSLWESGSLASRVGSIGARAALAVKPKRIDPTDIPTALTDRHGVRRLDEQVIEPASFIGSLAQSNSQHLVHGEVASVDGYVHIVLDSGHESPASLRIRPRALVLTAGRGNADLRRQFGLTDQIQQIRPLHMVVARGPLPELNGHCIEGIRTRVTITSTRDPTGKTIWQLGGQIAERGVESDSEQLIEHAINEIKAVLPAVDLEGTEWMTYRVDRAEMAMSGRGRPADVQFAVEADPAGEMMVISAWPTKLALVPRLATRIAEQIGPPVFPDMDPVPGDTPRPKVAQPPWEEPSTRWSTVS